ncbi:hypothetical protein FQV19_0015911, partial [Eudyptula minor]
WPANDPGQSPNLPANRDMLQGVRGGLLESLELAGRKTINWAKVRECQQGNAEHPSEYYTRLVKQGRMFGGVNRENEENRTLMVSFFVDQSTPDIKKYFSKHMPGWQGKGLDEIVSIAAFVFNGRDERQLKQKKKKEKDR